MKEQKKRVTILVGTSSGWGRRLIKGIANYALKQGNWQISVEERGMDELMKRNEGLFGDGIIARVGDLRMANELKALNLPIVNVSSILLKGCEFPSITTDEEALGQMAVDHFTQKGFRHLAYFGFSHANYVMKRGESFKKYALEQGFSCEVYHTPLKAKKKWELQRTEIREWIKALPKPVGVLSWGTTRGRSIINLCQEAGISVPQEVSVLSGDDDELLNEVCYPPLSGVVTSAEQIGHEAACSLEALMQGESVKESTTFVPQSINTRLSSDTLAIDDPLLRDGIQFIRDNIRHPLQVTDISDELGVSRRLLERRFEKFLGTSPAQEMQRYRLEYAKKLLRDSDLKVSDIAAKSGYCSNEYMIRIFQKSLGKTPMKYRTSMCGK